MSHSHGGPTDSAGQPWAGRQFSQNSFQADDGTAPAVFLAAMEGFRQGKAAPIDVIDALRGARLLIPLLANLAEEGVNDDGKKVDKSAELSIVTVAGPDGRDVLPVFSSVAAMGRWNPVARPVPADAVRVALAAAGENTELVVVDPASDTEFAIRRPAVAAIAQSLPFTASYEDAELLAHLRELVAGEAAIVELAVSNGDPTARLLGPELVLELSLTPGLDRDDLNALLARFQQGLSASALVADRVDSMAIRLVSAQPS